jgi:hypothetical protein
VRSHVLDDSHEWHCHHHSETEPFHDLGPGQRWAVRKGGGSLYQIERLTHYLGGLFSGTIYLSSSSIVSTTVDSDAVQVIGSAVSVGKSGESKGMIGDDLGVLGRVLANTASSMTNYVRTPSARGGQANGTVWVQ